jgi:hypothetical protein
MNTDNVSLVVCLGIAIAIGIPAILYLSLRRGNETNAIDLMRHAVSRSRFPWEEEDEALAELSRLVSDLKGQDSDPMVTPSGGEAINQEERDIS